MRQNAYVSWVLALVVGLALLFPGCDNTLDPFSENSGLFSVYGYLTLDGTQHFIRVQNLNKPVVSDSSRTLDATVTLENLETGQAETLTDSIVVFNGVATHNFESNQDIQPGAKYRLTVERSDGRSVQTTATMPERTEVNVLPPDTLSCAGGALLRFLNVPEPRLLHLSVGVLWEPNQWVWTDIEIPRPTESGALTPRFSPSRIAQDIAGERVIECFQGGPSEYCTLFNSNTIQVAYTHLGPDWPADTTLANPIESVRSGVGRFGGVHRDTLLMVVPGAQQSPPPFRCPQNVP